VSLARVHLLDFSGLTGVRQRLEDLHVNEIALASLDLDPIVGTGNDLLSDGNGSEVSDGWAELVNHLVLEGADHLELLLGEPWFSIPSTANDAHILFFLKFN
jgi:hypothetical protein